MQQPTIAAKPPLTVVGMERSFIHSQSPDANNLQVLGELWREFPPRAREIPNRVGHAMYGVIYERPPAERKHRHELQYIAGVAVSAGDHIPAGLVARTIPGATFAVFLHRGPINQIAATVREIYREWLPASPYQHAGIADIELYDDRFCADGPDSEMEYWISIQPK
ncbi:MAG TPA: GyrI-like domain-containing protein [Pirellulaceae bacterium]|nr:GyrI-like domain-containing protein [Pirellulaceae bacterium]